MIGAVSASQKSERIGFFSVKAEKNFLQKILFDKEIVVFRGLVKVQIVHLSAVNDINTAGEHRVGRLSDLVDPASLEKIDDLDKVVGMTVGGDVADVFFDQDAFFVDKMRIFFIDPHAHHSFLHQI